jgi:hydroxyacylglutathione hydrolase
MKLKIFVFNTFMVNCYLIYDDTCEAVIIDASCYDVKEQKQVIDFISTNNLKLVRNINTHCHIDHILGNAFIEDTYGIRPEYHPDAAHFFVTAKEIGLSFGYRLDRIPEPKGYLEDGDIISFGHSELKVLSTPGHAAGSICLYSGNDGFVITGDVLFRETIGRTDLPTGDFDQLMDSIKNKLFTLPPETTVWPGHGPETTISYEMVNNPFIR